MVSSVDLPAPLGPTSAVTPPEGMSVVTGPICTVPVWDRYSFRTASMVITGAPSA